MSDTVEGSAADLPGPPGGTPGGGNGLPAALRRSAAAFVQQREATILVVAIALVIYFRVAGPNFFTKLNIDNISQAAAPLAIIAIGEVMLLVCGEMDLSVGFVWVLSPFLMHYFHDFWGVPVIPAILLALIGGALIGFINGFVVVYFKVPAFITTLGTSLAVDGLMLTTSHAYPAQIPKDAEGIGHWIGTYAWAEISWAVALVIVFHTILTRTRWGLHTISVGGNLLGASEAGINVARIKVGNFMLTSTLGAFVGIMEAFRNNTIDPSAGGYQPMFYAMAAAVIGGTAMAGGSGTIAGALLGALVLGILQDGFNLIGISANPYNIILGVAIIVAMIANTYLARLRRAGRA